MYKIQGKLGLLKWEKENQNNSNFVWKVVSSGTADTAQAWDCGVRSLGHPFSLQCQSKKKKGKQNKQHKNPQTSKQMIQKPTQKQDLSIIKKY